MKTMTSRYDSTCDICRSAISVGDEIVYEQAGIHVAHAACAEKHAAKAMQLAAESAAKQGLPALVGSEKQVAWAATLRHELMQTVCNQSKHRWDLGLIALHTIYPPNPERYGLNPQPIAKLKPSEEFATVLKRLKELQCGYEAWVRQQSTAKWWIEQKTHSSWDDPYDQYIKSVEPQLFQQAQSLRKRLESEAKRLQAEFLMAKDEEEKDRLRSAYTVRDESLLTELKLRRIVVRSAKMVDVETIEIACDLGDRGSSREAVAVKYPKEGWRLLRIGNSQPNRIPGCNFGDDWQSDDHPNTKAECERIISAALKMVK